MFFLSLLCLIGIVRSNSVLELPNVVVDKYVSYLIPTGTKEVYWSLLDHNKIGVYILSNELNHEIYSSTSKQDCFTSLDPKSEYSFLLFNWNDKPANLMGSIFYVDDVSKKYKGKANTKALTIGGEVFGKFYILENTTSISWTTHASNDLSYSIFDHKHKQISHTDKVPGTSTGKSTFDKDVHPYYIQFSPITGHTTFYSNFTFEFPDTRKRSSWFSSYWWIFLVIFLPLFVFFFVCCVCLYVITYIFLCSGLTSGCLICNLFFEKSSKNRAEYQRLNEEKSHEEEIQRRNERDRKIIKELRIKFDTAMDRKNRRIQELQTAFQSSAKGMKRMVDQLRQMTSQSQDVIGKLAQRDRLIEQQSKSLAQTKTQMREDRERLEEKIQKLSESHSQYREAREGMLRSLRETLVNRQREIERTKSEKEDLERTVNEKEDLGTTYLHRIKKITEDRETREVDRVKLETKCDDFELKIHEYETSVYETEIAHNQEMRKVTTETSELQKKVKVLEQEKAREIHEAVQKLKTQEREAQERLFRETHRAERAEEELEDLRKRVSETELKLEEKSNEIKTLNMKYFAQISERDRAQSNIHGLVGESMEKMQLLQANITSLTNQLGQSEVDKRDIENEIKEKERLIQEKERMIENMKKDIEELKLDHTKSGMSHQDEVTEREKKIESLKTILIEKEKRISEILRRSEQRIAEKNILIAEKEKQSRSLRKEVEKIRAEHVDLQMKYFTKEKEKERSVEEMEKAQIRSSEKTELLKQTEDKITNLETIIDEKNESIEILEREIEQIEHDLKITQQKLNDEELNSTGLLKEFKSSKENNKRLIEKIRINKLEIGKERIESTKSITNLQSLVSEKQLKNSKFEKEIALVRERLRAQITMTEKSEKEKRSILKKVSKARSINEALSINNLRLESNVKDLNLQKEHLEKQIEKLIEARRKAEAEGREVEEIKDSIVKEKKGGERLFLQIMKHIPKLFDSKWSKAIKKIEQMENRIERLMRMNNRINQHLQTQEKFNKIQLRLSRVEDYGLSSISSIKKPTKDVSRLIKLLLMIINIESRNNVSWEILIKHLKGKNPIIRYIRAVLLFSPASLINKNLQIEMEEIKRIEREGQEMFQRYGHSTVLVFEFCQASLELVSRSKRARNYMRMKYQDNIEIPRPPPKKKKKKPRRVSKSPYGQ